MQTSCKKIIAKNVASNVKHEHKEVEDPFDLDNTTDENL
jgi:hypothetical protein